MSGPQVSLRQRLLVLAAASIFPLAVMSGVGLLVLVQQQRQQAQTAALEIARALSTAVDAELQRAMNCGDRIPVVLVSPGKIPAASSDRPCAEANGRNLQIGISEPACFHNSSFRI